MEQSNTTVIVVAFISLAAILLCGWRLLKK